MFKAMNMNKKNEKIIQNNKEKCFKDYSLYAKIEGVFSKAINTMNDTIIDTNKKKEKKMYRLGSSSNK